jgi:hypothetical protein
MCRVPLLCLSRYAHCSSSYGGRRDATRRDETKRNGEAHRIVRLASRRRVLSQNCVPTKPADLAGATRSNPIARTQVSGWCTRTSRYGGAARGTPAAAGTGIEQRRRTDRSPPTRDATSCCLLSGKSRRRRTSDQTRAPGRSGVEISREKETRTAAAREGGGDRGGVERKAPRHARGRGGGRVRHEKSRRAAAGRRLHRHSSTRQSGIRPRVAYRIMEAAKVTARRRRCAAISFLKKKSP